MERKTILLNNIPAILWGEESNKIYLYIHGKMGNKEEVEKFADIFCSRGYQILSIDLPEHGDRKKEINTFYPWNIVPELQVILNELKLRWEKIGIVANSIGAWFSLVAFNNESIENCLFIAPVLNMEELILNMMKWAGISSEELKIKEEIETTFGETLSWRYYKYTLDNPINRWNIRTKILYPEKDEMTDKKTVEEFVKNFNAELEILEGSEHYIYKLKEIEILRKWIEINI